MADDKLQYIVTVDDKGTPQLKKIKKGFEDVDKGAKGAGASMVANGVLIADAAKAIAGKVVELGKSVLAEADDFRKFGASVGLSTAEVAGLDRVFSLAGSSTEGMKSAFLSLSAALDPEKVTKQRTAVEQLGISVTNADGSMKTHRQLLMDVADAYKNETSEVKKAAIGKRIFGGAAFEVNEILSMGSVELEKQATLYADASGYTQDMAIQMESFNDAMSKVEISLKGVLAQIGNSEIFQNAIQYISDLSDEWVRFLAELKTDKANQQTNAIYKSLNDLGARYDKIYTRKAGGLPYEHDAEKASEATIKLLADGANYSQVLMEQQLAIKRVIDAEKQKGKTDAQLAPLYAELNTVSKDRKRNVGNEAAEVEKLRKAEEKAAKERRLYDKAGKEKADEAPKAREFDATALMEKRRREEEQVQKSIDDAKRESQDADRLYNEELKAIRLENATEYEREKQNVRDWYEEKRAILGNDADLRIAYENRMREVEANRQQAELDHLAKVQQMEAARFDMMNTIAQASFNFLHNATAGYKSLGGVAKAVAYAEAMWNTYVAYTKALSEYGPIAGPILGGIALANGVAMAAKINAQKFADGGIVGGSSYYGDTVPVYANSGEMFINTSQQAQLYNMLSGKSSNVEKLREKNAGTGKSVNINVNGMMVDNKTIRKMQSAFSTVMARA